MARTPLIASHLGNIAYQVLQRQQTAVVSGSSSRGIFLQPKRDLTLYLSFEKFRGPLTLNLTGDKTTLFDIQPGWEVSLSPGVLTIPSPGIKIDLSKADIWQAAPAENKLPFEFSIEQLKTLIEKTLKLTIEREFQPLLKSVLPGNPVSIPGVPGFSSLLSRVLTSLESKDLVQAGKQFQGLIGLGPGLTPIGDDFILGTLLSVNRLSDSFLQENTLKKFNQSILDTARIKTTQLSYSLLACAAEGSADERLLKVLDSLIAGEGIRDQDLTKMLNWGSSSGIAVLAGMLAILARLPY